MLSREPSTSSRSAFCTVKLPARSPIVPGRPQKSGSSVAIRSWVQAVVTGNAQAADQLRRIRRRARAARTPVPARITGRLALANALAAFRGTGRASSAASSKCNVVLGWIVGAKTSPRIDQRGLHVDRDIEPAGPGPPGLREVPGALQVIADRVRVVDEHGVFGDAARPWRRCRLPDRQLAQAGDAAGARMQVSRFTWPEMTSIGIGIGPCAKDAVERVDAAGAGGDIDHAGVPLMRA